MLPLAIVGGIVTVTMMFNQNSFTRVANTYNATTIEKEFENTLSENKILSVEIENQYFNDNETLRLFYPKKLKVGLLKRNLQKVLLQGNML